MGNALNWSLKARMDASSCLLFSSPVKPTCKSAPAQKAFPEPVRTMARTLSSLLKSSYAASISVNMVAVTALYFSGRFRESTTTFVAVEDEAGTWEMEMSLKAREV